MRDLRFVPTAGGQIASRHSIPATDVDSTASAFPTTPSPVSGRNSMIKRISEAELHGEYVLQERSRAAVLTFGAGLAGSILCIVVFFLTMDFLAKVQSRVDYVNANRLQLTLDEREAIRKEIDELAITFFRYGTPLFLTANALWIIGGYAWTIDLKRQPSNRFLRRLGGLLVLLTAGACGTAWFLLIRLSMQFQE